MPAIVFTCLGPHCDREHRVRLGPNGTEIFSCECGCQGTVDSWGGPKANVNAQLPNVYGPRCQDEHEPEDPDGSGFELLDLLTTRVRAAFKRHLDTERDMKRIKCDFDAIYHKGIQHGLELVLVMMQENQDQQHRCSMDEQAADT